LGIDLFKPIPPYKIIACGGDGTAGWVLNTMDKIYSVNDVRPPVGVIPLGTGNFSIIFQL
jgi:diacylglycerol kinase (ATP)